MNYVKKEEKSAAARMRSLLCRSNTAFSLNNEPPEPIRTGAEKGMETRGLDDEMRRRLDDEMGGGLGKILKLKWRKKFESLMHVTLFLCLFLIYTHVVDLNPSSFVLHLSKYHAHIIIIFTAF